VRIRELEIGEFGRLVGIAPHVLRHWEAVGVLPPPLRHRGRRLYHQPHVRHVAMIVCAQTAGLALPELREILEATTVSARREKLEQHLATLTTRIAQLKESKRIVQEMHAWTREEFSECPIFARRMTTVVRRPTAVVDQQPLVDSTERKSRKNRF